LIQHDEEQQMVRQREQLERKRLATVHGGAQKRTESRSGLTKEEKEKLETLELKRRQRGHGRASERRRALAKGLCEGVLVTRKNSVPGEWAPKCVN
jgi:hypothetical protein